ncbi:DUF6088 family protein [Metamycoplasma alkalescens]|uniref:Transcriptional regulator, AbiEi antitoxin, Type IV TA system n=3 Tax=Metamycoplasma alkalescens TaxID=45363 RepID=A0A318U446_9BACT|nr:DUF6088 family protein [Metamycoplasma alkalescens]PYF41927.1 hypothetical protein BCF88_1223 [Metamycoplasma alkalescens]
MVIKKEIENIMKKNIGKIYSINDFYNYDLGSQNTIKCSLYKLAQENKIIRVFDGLYMKPRFSKIFQENVIPSTKEIIDKIAKKFGWDIIPTSEWALNYTGLSTQVPNVYIFASTGPNRIYYYGNNKIIFKHVANYKIYPFSKKMALVIQALIVLEKNNVTKSHLKKLANFTKDIKNELTKNINLLPVWIQENLKKIKDYQYA